jgi:hypothetical protein
MSKPKSPKPKPKRTWRDIPDGLHRGFSGWPSPPSLHPDDSTIFDAVAGNIAARAVVDAWAFRFPVRIVSEVLA